MAQSSDVEADQKAEEAYQLRKQGKSYRFIARELGYAGPGPAYKAVQRGQARHPESTEQERALDDDRYADLLDSLYMMLPHSENPLFVYDRILKVLAQRAQLLGLNKPVVVEDDLGDQLVGLFKRVRERYKRLREAAASSDAGGEDA